MILTSNRGFEHATEAVDRFGGHATGATPRPSRRALIDMGLRQ